MKMTNFTFWGFAALVGAILGLVIGGFAGYPIEGIISGAIAVPLFVFAYCEYLLRKRDG